MSGRHREWTLDTVRSRCTEEGDCWIWTQAAIQGLYPQACIHGKNTRVQRFVWVELMHKRMFKGCVISTACRNTRCCSPKCLVMLTRSEMQARAYADGKRAHESAGRRQRAIRQGWATKLDMEKARQIRARANESSVVLGSEFNVPAKSIREIWRGRRWREQEAISSVFSWRPS